MRLWLAVYGNALLANAQRSGLRSYSGSWTLPPESSLVHGHSTAVLVTSSTITFTAWMFPNVSSSNCAWLCKCLHGSAPSCAFRLRMLTDGRRQLRSASRGLLNFPRYNVSNYGRRVFCFAGPHVWNSLPEHIRKWTSTAVFKRSLKTFLLQQISHPAH